MPKISEEQLEARRTSILRAAIRCYRRDGYFETQMKDIAAEAGISVGLLYRYFDDKQDLLEAVMRASRASDRKARTAATSDLPPAEGLRALAHEIIALHGDPDRLAMLRGNVRAYGEATRLEGTELDAVRPALAEAVEDFGGLLRRGQADGDFDPGIDPEAAARMMIAMIIGSNVLRVFDPEFDARAHGEIVERMIDGLVVREDPDAAPD